MHQVFQIHLLRSFANVLCMPANATVAKYTGLD